MYNSKGIMPSPIRDIGKLLGAAGVVIKYAFWGGVLYLGLKACNANKAHGETIMSQPAVYQQSNYIDQKAQANQQFGIGSQLEKITQYVK